jgi:hypothetical protein
MANYELYLIQTKLNKHSKRIEGLLGAIEKRDEMLFEMEMEMEKLRKENAELRAQ